MTLDGDACRACSTAGELLRQDIAEAEREARDQDGMQDYEIYMSIGYLQGLERALEIFVATKGPDRDANR